MGTIGTSKRGWTRLKSLLGMCALLGACGGVEEDLRSFAAETDDGVFAIALLKDDTSILYFCGRDATLRDSTAWTLGGPRATAQFIATEGADVNASLAEDVEGLAGEWQRAGRSAELTLPPAEGETALYRKNGTGEMADCLIAAIVLDDQIEPRVQGAVICDGDVVEQVTPVRLPTTSEPDLIVSAPSVGGLMEMSLSPVLGD